MDPKAAEMLHTYLTGYATLRKFYDLRDEEITHEEGQKPTVRPNARKTAAATALLAVISSAADNIQGGLYDESRASVVQVDGLLSLLGEALVFVNRMDLSECKNPRNLSLTFTCRVQKRTFPSSMLRTPESH